MIKKLVVFLLTIYVMASNLEITSKNFQYDKIKNISYFKNDVNVTKGKDNILSDILIVYFDKDKKIKKIIAKQNVRFLLYDENSTYKGISDEIIYTPKNEIFVFEGNVHITKLEDNQQLFGNKVIINKKTGESKVFGGENKPVKFILKVKDSED